MNFKKEIIMFKLNMNAVNVFINQSAASYNSKIVDKYGLFLVAKEETDKDNRISITYTGTDEDFEDFEDWEFIDFDDLADLDYTEIKARLVSTVETIIETVVDGWEPEED